MQVAIHANWFCSDEKKITLHLVVLHSNKLSITRSGTSKLSQNYCKGDKKSSYDSFRNSSKYSFWFFSRISSACLARNSSGDSSMNSSGTLPENPPGIIPEFPLGVSNGIPLEIFPRKHLGIPTRISKGISPKILWYCL